MYEDIYVMKNKRIGSVTGSFDSDEEIVEAQKIVAQKRSMYESEQVKMWKEMGIFRERWDKNYKDKNKENLRVHTSN